MEESTTLTVNSLVTHRSLHRTLVLNGLANTIQGISMKTLFNCLDLEKKINELKRTCSQLKKEIVEYQEKLGKIDVGKKTATEEGQETGMVTTKLEEEQKVQTDSVEAGESGDAHGNCREVENQDHSQQAEKLSNKDNIEEYFQERNNITVQ